MSQMLNTINAALVRALERRFGKSVLPYDFRKPHIARDEQGRERRQCIDPETGSYVIAVILPSGRIRVVSEHDGA